MLSLFPELLFLSPFAAFFIRITVAVFCAVAGYRQYQRRSSLPRGLTNASLIMHAALVILIGVGLYTQAAALFAALSALVGLFPPARLKPMVAFPKSTIILFIVMALSLVLTGAGPFAFDLPL